MMLAFLLLLAALPPEHVVRQDDARITWRENMCAGFKANDCSVREPMTATVRVYFDGRDVPGAPVGAVQGEGLRGGSVRDCRVDRAGQEGEVTSRQHKFVKELITPALKPEEK
jgi:hypothetical protein